MRGKPIIPSTTGKVSLPSRDERVPPLTRPGTERWARRQRAGAHAEARAERWRNVAEEIAATGAVAVVRSGSGDIGAHPLAAGFAERIDTLHGKTGHVLHFSPSEAAKLRSILVRPQNGRA